MRTKSKELDVDFIGGQSLTEQEEKLISEFIKSHKKQRLSKSVKAKQTLRKKKVLA